MTVETEERLVVYRGNGLTTIFPFEFDIPEADFATVTIQDFDTGTILDTLTPGTYTLNGVGNPLGGNVVYPLDATPVLDDTKQLVIVRTVPYTQEMSISNQGGFHPEVLEEQLDLIVMQIQQIAEQQGRSLIVNPGQDVPDLTAIAAAEYWAGIAVDAAEQASQYASFAKHDWVPIDILGNGVQTEWALGIDPGVANNIFVELNGTFQRPGDAYTLEYVLTVPTLRFTEAVPNGVKGLARMGSALIVNVNVPTDGSVTTPKVVNNAITLAKIQDIATLSLLGRKTAGTGDPEVLTPADVRDSFFPQGSIVDSVSVANATYTTITAVIPADDTIPQVGEGTQVLTVGLTPKLTANKLRIRFKASLAGNGTGTIAIYSIFVNGAANAIKAGYTSVAVLNEQHELEAEVEISPASVALQTISVRLGTNAGSIFLNGNSSGRIFGGVMSATLTVEEIKV